MNTRSPRAYLEFMLKSPLAVWWACATFAAEMLVSLLPAGIIQLPRVWLAIAVFFVSLCVFASVVVLYKGWVLYSRTQNAVSILEITRSDNEHVFILESGSSPEVGSVLEVHRIRESAEVPIGLIEVTLCREDGKTQARPVWIGPGHLREIETRELSARSLIVHRTPHSETLSKWINEQADQKIQDLIRRGAQA